MVDERWNSCGGNGLLTSGTSQDSNECEGASAQRPLSPKYTHRYTVQLLYSLVPCGSHLAGGGRRDSKADSQTRSYEWTVVVDVINIMQEDDAHHDIFGICTGQRARYGNKKPSR